MEVIELFVAAGITLFSFGLLVLSLVGLKKTKDTRMIFVSAMFLMFLVKGILYTYSLFQGSYIFFDSILNVLIVDLIILILLFISSLKG